jgi:peptidase A4-like protein
MRSLRISLAGVTVLAVTLGLIAIADPVAGATGMPATGRQQNACSAGTATSLDSAGYAACGTSEAPSFTAASGITILPDIPSCDDCTLSKVSREVLLGDNKPTAPSLALAQPVEGVGVTIEQVGNQNEFFTWYAIGAAPADVRVEEQVQPGDRLVMQVTRHNNTYTFAVTDTTNPGDSFSKSVPCGTCTYNTARWVIRRAQNPAGGYFPMPNFGTWAITNAKASTATGSGTIKSFPNLALTMVNSANPPQTLVSVGALNAQGNSFTDTWLQAS